MTNDVSACGRFMRCILPCCFSEEPQQKEKALVRYENNNRSSPLGKRKVKLLSTEMVNIRQILHERMPTTKG